MPQPRRHLTYANVVSTLVIFLLLGGATAVAAKKIGTKQLKAGSVTAAKLKRNAVATNKIRNGAVTGAKLAANSVDGAKIADGSVTGADINAASTPFSQYVARLGSTVQVPFTAGAVYPFTNSTYTQPAGRDDFWLGSLEITFASTCNPPRSAQANLLVNAANQAMPTPDDIVANAVAQDFQAGTVTKKADFTTSLGAAHPMSSAAPVADTVHSFSIFLVNASCSSGSGITATGATLDVIGTR